MAVSDLTTALNRPPDKAALGYVAQLLERHNIDTEKVGALSHIGMHQMLIKNDAGEAEIHDLFGFHIKPELLGGPQWPVVQPGPVYKLPPVKAKPRDGGLKTCVILPDIQLGFYREYSPSGDGELVSTHDDVALDIALAITKRINPDKVVLLGDNLDLPEFGKYRLSNAYALTTQATIDRATELGAQVRNAAPHADIHWLSGNHEERLVNYVIDNAKAAFGLRRGNSPTDWPVLSVPYLCRFDDYGIQYVPGYPAGQVWINQRLRCVHGFKVRSNGSTAHAYLNSEKTSIIYGHIHRREWAERSREDWDGAKTIMAASPGTLAKTTGEVPSTKGGIDLDGRPLTIVEDWQQGIAVVHYEEGDGDFWYQQVPIHNGKAFYNGKVYSAE